MPNDENFFVTQYWMISRLNLKGNELKIYAIIYGFSQTYNQNFTGSLQYLADWTNSTKQGVLKNLQSLVEKGYIEKFEKKIGALKFVEYRATELNAAIKQSLTERSTQFNEPIKQSLPNNINKNTSENITENKETISDVQRVAEMYNETCVSFPSLRSLSEARKKAIKARLKTYSLEDFKTLFQKAEASSFLKGGNARDWSATFDWLIKDSNMAKVLDGNYDDKNRKQFGRNGVELLPENERLHDLDGIF